jgi:hypothetical protein
MSDRDPEERYMHGCLHGASALYEELAPYLPPKIAEAAHAWAGLDIQNWKNAYLRGEQPAGVPLPVHKLKDRLNGPN